VPNFKCTCNACYTGRGTTALNDGCYLPPFPGLTRIGREIVLPPAINTIRAGDVVAFKFSYGCDTGASIFLPGFPRWVLNVSCETFVVPKLVDGVDGIIMQPLLPGPGRGAWTYDTRTFTYFFSVLTDRKWASLCAVLEMKWNQDFRPRNKKDVDTTRVLFHLTAPGQGGK
jgi:hypothetical protein